MSHSFLPVHTDYVSLLLGNAILLAMPLSQLFLLAGRMVYPIMIIQNRLMMYPSLLILHGPTQILALLQKRLFKTVLGGKKTMGIEVGQTWDGQVT